MILALGSEHETGLARYFENSGNRLDALVVSFGVTALVLELTGGLSLLFGVARVVKSLRPLRLVHRIPSLHNCITALRASVTAIFNLVMVIVVFGFGWSVIGKEMFRQKFHRCTNPDFPEGASRFGEVNDAGTGYRIEPCESYENLTNGAIIDTGFTWEAPSYNFDSIFNSMVCTFIVSVDGWSGIMYSAMDSNRVDYQPQENASGWAALYFVAGNLLFHVYLLNLFIDVVFDTYLVMRTTNSEGLLMKPEEWRWLDYDRHLKKIKPKFMAPPKGRWRRPFFDFTKSRAFYYSRMSLIMSFVFTVSYFSDDLPRGVNILYAVAFAVEAIVKIIAMGCRRYWKNGANMVDGFIAITGLLEVLLTEIVVCKDSGFLSGIRALRAFRVVRLFDFMPDAKTVVQASFKAIRQLVNVALIMIIIIIVLANMGVVLFGDIDLATAQLRFVHFGSVLPAVEAVFLIAAGDSMASILQRMLMLAPNRSLLIILYVLLITVCISFLMMNLFVVVLSESYEVLTDKVRSRIHEYIPRFREIWAEYDPYATGFLLARDLSQQQAKEVKRRKGGKDGKGKKSQGQKQQQPQALGRLSETEKVERLRDFLLQLPQPMGAKHLFEAKLKIMLLQSQGGFNYEFSQILIGLSAIWLHDLGICPSEASDDLQGMLTNIRRASIQSVGQGGSMMSSIHALKAVVLLQKKYRAVKARRQRTALKSLQTYFQETKEVVVRPTSLMASLESQRYLKGNRGSFRRPSMIEEFEIVQLGLGDATPTALADGRKVTQVKWHTVDLDGRLGRKGRHHHFLMVQVGSWGARAIDLAMYVVERSELSPEPSISFWDDISSHVPNPPIRFLVDDTLREGLSMQDIYVQVTSGPQGTNKGPRTSAGKRLGVDAANSQEMTRLLYRFCTRNDPGETSPPPTGGLVRVDADDDVNYNEGEAEEEEGEGDQDHDNEDEEDEEKEA